MDMINASGERKKREFYLFNDSFLVAKTQGDDKLKHLAMVPFDMILINSITDSPGKITKWELGCEALNNCFFFFSSASRQRTHARNNPRWNGQVYYGCRVKLLKAAVDETF